MKLALTAPVVGSRARACLVTLLLCGAAWLAGATGAAPQSVPRIVAIGDIHGDATRFKAILERMALVDAGGRWTGGTSVLVQTGDFVDRGTEVRAVVDLLMALEPQAKSAGGRVVVLLGNHEAMNAMADLRYVAPAVLASFVDAKSEGRRESAFKAHARLAERRREALERADPAVAVPPVYQSTSREAWMQAHPPGYLEYVDAFGPDGRYGRWIRRLPAVARVGDTVFVHGGIDPEIGYRTLEHATNRAHTELTYFDRMRVVMARDGISLPFHSFTETIEAGRSELARVAATASPTDPRAAEPHRLAEVLRLGTWSIIAANGPLWFRGYATWTDEEGSPLVDRLQQQYGRVRFVVGHTQTEDRRITPRFDNRVFLIDTALSSHYEDGRASALEIVGGQYVAVTMDERRVLVGADAPAVSGVGRQPAATSR
jgi:hypothetical protein